MRWLQNDEEPPFPSVVCGFARAPGVPRVPPVGRRHLSTAKRDHRQRPLGMVSTALTATYRPELDPATEKTSCLLGWPR